jgi:hypothetical protein
MTDWKQTIEAQIADLRRYSYESDDPTDEIRQLIDSMHNAATQLEALLDVAVAAETYERLDNTNARLSMRRALDKLREVGDEEAD